VNDSFTTPDKAHGQVWISTFRYALLHDVNVVGLIYHCAFARGSGVSANEKAKPDGERYVLFFNS